MEKMNDVAVWFEIPVKDMNRAVAFYSRVMNVDLKVESWGPISMAVFPIKGEGVHGALVKGDEYQPSDKGPVLYLNGGDDCAAPLGRVAAAGGKVLKEKFSIGQHGFIGFFLDTEGNRLAFHSAK